MKTSSESDIHIIIHICNGKCVSLSRLQKTTSNIIIIYMENDYESYIQSSQQFDSQLHPSTSQRVDA